MNSSSRAEIIVSKINEFHRIAISDSDDKIKGAIQEILRLWPEVLNSANEATDDDLFALNISRAVLTQVFAIAVSKDFFNKDYLLIRDIFFTCFDILVDHADIFTNENPTPITTFIDSNVRLIMKMSSSIISLVKFKNGDLSKDDDHQLLIAMREHIDKDSKHDNLTDGLISFIWNLSDRTILVPSLLSADYANSVIEWIKTREIKFRDDKLDAPLHILHNLSRHDDGIDLLNTYGALDIIEHIKIEPNACDDIDDIAVHIAMTRALLTDSNHIKFDARQYPNKIVNMITQLTIEAAKNDRCRHNGSHVSEPLTVLVKLFYNDEILHNFLCKIETKPPSTTQSIVELFASLLIKFYPHVSIDNDLLENFTCIVILNLFWLISKHQQYHQIMCDHEPLINVITNAANDEERFVDIFMPRTMKSIKQAANDILKNLNSKS